MKISGVSNVERTSGVGHAPSISRSIRSCACTLFDCIRNPGGRGRKRTVKSTKAVTVVPSPIEMCGIRKRMKKR